VAVPRSALLGEAPAAITLSRTPTFSPGGAGLPSLLLLCVWAVSVDDPSPTYPACCCCCCCCCCFLFCCFGLWLPRWRGWSSLPFLPPTPRNDFLPRSPFSGGIHGC
jgi:hypothetical protein